MNLLFLLIQPDLDNNKNFFLSVCSPKTITAVGVKKSVINIVNFVASPNGKYMLNQLRTNPITNTAKCAKIFSPDTNGASVPAGGATALSSTASSPPDGLLFTQQLFVGSHHILERLPPMLLLLLPLPVAFKYDRISAAVEFLPPPRPLQFLL